MSTKHVLLTLATLAVGAWAVATNAQSTVHLYIYDTHTGTVTQATGPMEWDPYNASFSNNGKRVVHDLTDNVTFADADARGDGPYDRDDDRARPLWRQRRLVAEREADRLWQFLGVGEFRV